ncbi:MAG: TIGR00645 family protein [Betaproteobacteria bacterium]|nr:MAG: TIGR00645 family protein [Betaproteobacteria bacterium]
MQNPKPATSALGPLPRWIFMSRWLQAPLYIGLIVAQGVYVWQFWTELIHLIGMLTVKSVTETEIMLIVLGLIDVVMISNLLVMVIVGGWETFVSRLELEKHPDQPEWLSHVNAGVLKVKLATAIIGISSIHLLKSFINAAQYDEKTLLWQTMIHLTFVISALAIAYTEKITQSAQAHRAPRGGGVPAHQASH